MKRSVRFATLLLSILMIFSVVPISSSAQTQPKIAIASAAISLDDNIYIYFDVVGEGFDTESGDYGFIIWNAIQPGFEYTVDNANASNSVRYGRAEWKYDGVLGREACQYKYAVSAKEMADVIYARAYVTLNGTTYYSSVIPYSVHTYAARKLGYVTGVSASSDESLKELLVGMLSYGALAQSYFEYNTSVPANAFMDVRHTHSVSSWSIVSETDTEIIKLSSCNSCGLVQSVTESKSNEPVEAELAYETIDGECYVMGLLGDYSGKQIIINIPEGVVGISENAFDGMANIISVTLPNGLKSIGAYAFRNCTNIPEITIPESVNKIEFYAFNGCTSLDSITFDSPDCWFSSLDETELDFSDPNENVSLICGAYDSFYKK